MTIGIDPGFRTGCKIAVVDGTGKFVTSTTIYPDGPEERRRRRRHASLKELIAKYDVRLIAIGNGTASRETDEFVAGVLKSAGIEVTKAMVSESGASIYSASELAVPRVSRPRRHRPRRHQHRASLAGSAGRTGEARPQIDRRRPVPARRQSDAAAERRSTARSSRASTRSASI